MAGIEGVTLLQDADAQMEKAEQLLALAQGIANKIEEIDIEIENLVSGGLKGTAVKAMSQSYINNREVINDFIKRFATSACILYNGAEDTKNYQMQATDAAGGYNG